MCRVVLLGIILLGMQRGKECQPMAIGLLMEFPVMGQEQYDAVIDELELGGLMPAGGISHIAGPTETGWRMVEVWESQEAFDLFFRDRLHQALHHAGIEPPQVDAWPVYNTLAPAHPL
jgi:hypothetical protein